MLGYHSTMTNFYDGIDCYRVKLTKLGNVGVKVKMARRGRGKLYQWKWGRCVGGGGGGVV